MKIFVFISLFAACLQANVLTPVWIELGPDGARLARVIVDTPNECPVLKADGKPLRTALRTPVPDGFKPACEAKLPEGTKSVKFGRISIHVPAALNNIAVVGDTGCRVKKESIQACDDPEQWPFGAVAGQIARSKPDLIIHVGDYLYRESPCPEGASGCRGPSGDNWLAWQADFFQPAAPALSAAPWIFARGNHESKRRSCVGWFYYLDPQSYAGNCAEYSEPYIAQVGDLRIGVLDTGGAADDRKPHPAEAVEFADQLAKLSGKVDWIVDHHPVWQYSYTSDKSPLTPIGGAPFPGWQAAKPEGVKLVLSGHLHLFEFIGFGGDRPNQLIAGDGGTQLEVRIADRNAGETDSGMAVKAGELTPRFGFTHLHRAANGWNLELRNAAGKVLLTCDRVDQPSPSCKSQQ